MPQDAPLNLRRRLRQDTRNAHERLDALVSGFDLATRDGLCGFLRMQSGALFRLKDAARAARCGELVASLGDLAARDLSTLGAGRPVSVSTPWQEPPDPLALDYVLLGSRLGTQVLRKRWEASGDADVRAACAYFSAPGHLDMWRDFCDRSGSERAEGAKADQVVRDAIAVFGFYESCAIAAQEFTEVMNA